MARTPNTSKHPALAAKAGNSLQEISESTGKGKLSDLVYWKDLSGQEQMFLGQYVYYRDIGLAARVSGVSLDWVAKKCKGVEGFQEVLDYVMEYPKELAKAIAEEAMPRAVMKLKDIIDSSENHQTVIRATKELRDMALLLGDQPWFCNGGLPTMNFINIQGFDNPTDGKVVEG